MSVAIRGSRRRTRVAVLASVAVASLFVLVSPFGGTPAKAEWNNCSNHVVSLDPVPGLATAVRASSNTNLENGDVGACAMTLGGCLPVSVAPCFITGASVTGEFIPGDPSMTGVLVRPMVCWEAHPVEEGCVNAATNGAEVDPAGHASVCVLQNCRRI